MTERQWLQLSLETRAEQAEQVAALLESMGALSVTLQDSADAAIFEARPGDTALWPHTRVSALFPPATAIEPVLHRIHDTLQTATPLPHTLEYLRDQAWERAWLERFQPMRFGRRLWVCPTGHAPPDPQAVNLMLDPGLAFGTGTHATTALCLEWLDQADVKGRTVVDYGCGSGILAIAAARLGARQVWAVDVDPQALEATAGNAVRNQVAARITTCLPEALPDFAADCVIANILAQPLVELAPTLAGLLSSQGRLVLSGILAGQQAQMVQAAYRPWFEFTSIKQREEWARLDAIKLDISD